MKMWVVIEDDKIKDCKWKTYGCASAIGSTSALSEMVIGMTVDEALDVTPDDIQKSLGGMPSAKIHCSVLGDKALRAAIYDYFRKTDQVNRIKATENVICHCLMVTKEEIVQCVHDGLVTVEEIQERTKAGTGCGGCLGAIEDVIEDALASGGGHH
jgi:bacterioferritin-associated ferredoxin